MITSFNEYHLGDNLIHLHYLRKMALRYPAQQFLHFVQRVYIKQLIEAVEDLGNVAVDDINHKPPEAINVWKNRHGDFYTHPLRNDWAAYHIEFFHKLSAEFGLVSPMCEARDFLMSAPRIASKSHYPAYDCLVINSPPQSNQLKRMGGFDLDRIIQSLMKKGHSVIATAKNGYNAPVAGLSLMDIGSLSLGCKNIIGVATAPLWPCLNIWNDAAYKLFFLDDERVNISPNTEHAETYDEAMGRLTARGLL